MQPPPSDENDDANPAAICAIYLANKQLGVACFNELDSTLHVEHMDCNVDNFADAIHSIKLACEPTLFLVHPAMVSSTSFMETLRTGTGEENREFDCLKVKSAAWSVEACKELLRNRIQFMHNDVIAPDKMALHLSSMIDLDHTALLKALSALLQHIQRQFFQLDDGIVKVSGVYQIKTTQFMRIDAASFKALHIFSEEFHPNVIKSKGKSKEGYSLFALFDRTRSVPGRSTLRSWMQRPFTQLADISARQDGVAMAMRPENLDYVAHVSKPLRQLSDLPRLLLKIKKATATYKEWLLIHRTLSAALDILDFTLRFLSECPFEADKQYLARIFSACDVETYRFITEFLHTAIDFEVTSELKILTIREGYNSQLDAMRELSENLPAELNHCGALLLDKAPLIQDLNVEYVPQLGYLVAVDKRDAPFLDEHYFQFKYEDEKCYYKCAVVEELDERLGDIDNEVLDYQKKMLLEIEEGLLEREVELHQLSYALGALDAILSMGQVALERGYTRPEVVESNIIVIKNGRHPLQESTVQCGAFIPNDTCILEDRNVALITGVNNSGKSIYLKQVGLMVYLAHIGSYIPCERAIIGQTDRILTRISSIETSGRAQSSFTLDLNQMSHMLATYSERSLCLIDEFGKGTSPIDGIALLSTTIAHFTEHKAKALFVLHFTEALDPEILDPAAMSSIQVFEMSCLGREYPEDDETDDKPLMPLYKLKIGMAKSSEGIPCARSAGIHGDILERAVEIKKAIRTGGEIRALESIKLTALANQQHRSILKLLLTEDWTTASNAAIEAFQQALNEIM